LAIFAEKGWAEMVGKRKEILEKYVIERHCIRYCDECGSQMTFDEALFAVARNGLCSHCQEWFHKR
jgi:hypothetical protein